MEPGGHSRRSNLYFFVSQSSYRRRLEVMDVIWTEVVGQELSRFMFQGGASSDGWSHSGSSRGHRIPVPLLGQKLARALPSNSPTTWGSSPCQMASHLHTRRQCDSAAVRAAHPQPTFFFFFWFENVSFIIVLI